MKVYVIAAVSADGFIAKSSNEFIDWTSTEDKKFFREMTKKSGVVVMGGNTFRTFKSPLPGRRNIVYSRQKIDHPDVETTEEPPADLIKRLNKEGCQEVAVAGGSSIYSLFLSSDLITDVYLSVEPVMFGSGINLSQDNLNLKLKLNQVKKLNENTVLLHYKVDH